ncbi:MAG: M1 family metallopeptidase [Bacteroidia bacterium]|jgi:aminopeptidase N|nr:M1 family metallopeptidase [Bacteroidia bacterium]
MPHFKKVKTILLSVAVLTFQVAFSNSLVTDITHYHLSINTTQVFNQGIRGVATISCVTNPNKDSIILDLQGFQVDSVTALGFHLPFSKNDTQLIIKFPGSLLIKDTFQFAVFYRGAPARDPQWGGFYINSPYAFNLGVGFTVKPHNFGRAWFPCFDNFTDRATYTFHVITAPDLTAVCSGLLSHQSDSNNAKNWVWTLHQPIPTYLAGIAIGRYEFIQHSFTSVTGNIPVTLAVEAKDTSSLKLSFVRLQQALQCYEEKFGPYLFDRIGFVGVPFNAGAMEHATNIAYPLYAIDGTSTYETLMAHELSHHWWGNLTTCATAADMWLNEGWASYCEALFLECAYGIDAYQKNIEDKHIDVLLNAPKNDDGYLPVSGIPHEHTYGTTVYKKGAIILHALRQLMGDSSFFLAGKKFLENNRFKNMSSASFKDFYQTYTTVNLNHFLNQYILQPGHYDFLTTGITIENNTAQVAVFENYIYKSSPHQAISVDVLVYFSNGDSLFTQVNLQNRIGSFSCNLPLQSSITSIIYDPFNKLMLGRYAQKILLTGRGAVSIPNALLSLNVQSIPGNVNLHVQHHWVGATSGNLNTQGIRISNDRYWEIKGNLPETFLAWGFFNYDGSLNGSFTDRQLLSSITTEDSLVMLYRKAVNSNWTVLNNNQVTYQPGGQPNDKLGRFWVLRLAEGDYTFGVRDRSVVGIEPLKTNPHSHLQLIPNPGQKTLLSNSEEMPKGTVVRIINNIGIEVAKFVTQESKKQIVLDGKELPNQMYFVEITLPHKNPVVLKWLNK